jgi:hypothetical protein
MPNNSSAKHTLSLSQVSFHMHTLHRKLICVDTKGLAQAALDALVKTI